MKYGTKELCKDWKLDGDRRVVVAEVVAVIEKHFLKYIVQHIQKYSEKQNKLLIKYDKKELCDDWEL